MIPSARHDYNKSFTQAKYNSLLKDIDLVHPGTVEFRIAETPVFVPEIFTKKTLDTCESIIDLITDPSFKTKTDRAIPAPFQVPNENDHPHFIAFDFGVCLNTDGTPEPQL